MKPVFPLSSQLLPIGLVLLMSACQPQNTQNTPSPTPSPVSSASPSGSPSASPSPDQDPWQYVYNQRQEFNLCNEEIDQGMSQEVSQTYRIDENRYLVEFVCFMAAYQGNYTYFLYTETPEGPQLEELVFTRFVRDQDDNLEQIQMSNITGIPTYDPQTKQLSLYTKYRGLGDCGALAEYQLESGEFTLLEYREKPDCDGNYIEPEDYTKIYPK